MCGIIGAISKKRDVSRLLLDGLKRLEYRGYDSAGIAMLNAETQIKRVRVLGKVDKLISAFDKKPTSGFLGIAHTRWATHGSPSERNAHPHQSGNGIALVHNGIIENYETLHHQLEKSGYKFTSETDTETIVHTLHQALKKKKTSLLKATQETVKKLKGAFALAIVRADEPDHFIAVREGSPLVIGLGEGENYIASDTIALLPLTNKFIFLAEGDMAYITADRITIYNRQGKKVKRKTHVSQVSYDAVELGHYRHFMQKEIFEQIETVKATLACSLKDHEILVEAFGLKAPEYFKKTKRVQIVACGTSFHAAMVARYWLEEWAKLPCDIEIASEFRYRHISVEPDTLFITISQSGETADTLAALRKAKKMGYVGTLTICNVPESSLVRESDLAFITRAGIEVGVASTKAFTAQLIALLLLTLIFVSARGDKKSYLKGISSLQKMPAKIKEALKRAENIEKLANQFANKHHALFLGRGIQYPIALEGALKLKEISYIHAEGYPAGELKHGPLALVDRNMPVIAVAPTDDLLEKLKSNLQEVRARGGQLIVFSDHRSGMRDEKDIIFIEMPHVDTIIAPIIYTIPLQLLAYYVALIKGTDVDHPRNLAKSVTVE